MIDTMLVLIGGVLLLDVARWHRRFSRALARPPVPRRPPGPYPSLSVIRPVRGLDVDAEDNVRAALATSYPGEIETLFVFDDASDPALPVVRRFVDEHRGSAEILFAGARPARRTGKLHAMIVGLAHARGTIVAFGDSDTRPAPDLTTTLVDALLASPAIGATFAPVVVRDPPQTLGDVGYALMLDALYGPDVAWAAGVGGRLPFIMGQLMVFRRDALAAIGGPACADGYLVDDMQIGRCLDRIGYANVMIDQPLAITNRGLPLRQFFLTYRRWLMFGRNGIPLRITWPLWLRGAGAWFAAALLAVGLAAGSVAVAAIAACVLAAQGESLARLHARFGGAPIPLRFRWFPVALLLVAPFVVASTLWRRVEWRGRTYDLARAAETLVTETRGS